MTQGEEWKWMINRLSGNISQEEDLLLSHWIQSSRQNQVLFEEVTKLWESSTLKLQLNNPSTNEEWKKLQEKIQKSNKASWLTMPRIGLTAAASLVIIIGGIYLFSPSETSKPVEQTAPLADEQKKTEAPAETVPQTTNKPADKVKDNATYLTATSKVITSTLPDGSKVWLNTNSQISYSPTFKKDRKLTLQGEAYFIVTHDKQHPFTVLTKRINTEVLGTSFNVKEQNSDVIVTVATGKVKMTEASKGEQITISSKEQGAFQNGKITKSPNDLSSFAAWREKNNPSYEKEKKSASSYLTNNYSWKKNHINRSVIEGTLKNTATLATYFRIVLKATYQKPKSKKEVTVHITIDEPIRPGQTINYQKKLLDILQHTQEVKVEVEKFETLPNQYF